MPAPVPADLSVQVDRPVLPRRTTSVKKGAKALKAPKDVESPKPVDSPAAKVSNFFGWGARQNTMESPSTQFSDGTPMSATNHNGNHDRPPSPDYLAGHNYYGSSDEDGYFSSRSQSPLHYSAQKGSLPPGDLLRELQEVSAELASSIKREMDLEDEIDRFRSEMPGGPGEAGRRTSDYYSDSGASSSRLPAADTELKLEGLEKMRRKAEQEKAQLRVDMAQKVQDDLNQRKALELHIQSLEGQLQNVSSSGAASKERELESALEDTKRRLNEEKEFKQNFEELLSGMREEIEAHRNERDNLRDEVVPQLRAKLEGLESESAESQNLVYENTKMQQELQSLRNENQTLQNARKLQLDMQHNNGGGRFKSIAEEDESPGGLTRSGSLARSKSTRNRSSSIYGNGVKDQAGGDALPDRLKAIEDQRDALHRTVKDLVLRHDQISRKHAKQLRQLETERDQALHGSPRRAAFHVEVQSLRGEINHLRQRADDALEQKWQCEKGLSGLKMDLDRAQQETSSLRDLLHEHDIIVPNDLDNIPVPDTPTADPLDKAYAELRGAYSESLASLQGADGALPTSLEAVERRMQSLHQQVQKQQSFNSQLRHRLADAVGRGEKEQASSTRKITDLQSALRAAEERVMAAQNVSEDEVAKHEEHVREIKELVGEQNKRRVTPSPTSLTHPPSALFTGRSPRLNKTTSGRGMSVAEASRTTALETRVRELEEAAGQADGEMQSVVEMMNKAQIEVAELQMQRDEAMRQTRNLQGQIDEERERLRAIKK